jgi:hypothetical protein
MGVAACNVMVKEADPTVLAEYPVATAIAWTNSVEATEIGPAYTAEPVVGVEPFVV